MRFQSSSVLLKLVCRLRPTHLLNLNKTTQTRTQELPELWLVNVYTPNSGEGLKRLDYRTQQWDKALAGYIQVG